MTTIIFNSVCEYRLTEELFDKWYADRICSGPFSDYWNRQFDSPKLDNYIHPRLQYRLTFNSEEERTVWLLKNS